MLSYLLVAILSADAPIGLEIIRTYENPSGKSVFIAMPYSMDYGADGSLYLLDNQLSKIFVWSEDGSFRESFGARGVGPGQMLAPQRIAVTDDEIMVWEFRHVLSVFDLKGNFKKHYKMVGIEPRLLGELNERAILLGSRDVARDGSVYMKLYRLNRDTGARETLFDIPNEGVLKPIDETKGLAFAMKAFSPEIDLQKSGNRWLFGFSQDTAIYELDQHGAIAETRHFELPEQPLTEGDKELISKMSFPLPDGSRFKFKDHPGIRINYDHPKANYTHFLAKNGKIAFVLTPIGSLTGLNNGYSAATYYICDYETGEPLSRGSYALPEDSVVYYRNGRILACTLNQQGEYVIQEVGLPGL